MFPYMTKGFVIKILRWRDYFRLSKWNLNVSISAHIREGRGRFDYRKQYDYGKRDSCDMVGKMKVTQAKEHMQPPEAEIGKEMSSSPQSL